MSLLSLVLIGGGYVLLIVIGILMFFRKPRKSRDDFEEWRKEHNQAHRDEYPERD